MRTLRVVLDTDNQVKESPFLRKWISQSFLDTSMTLLELQFGRRCADSRLEMFNHQGLDERFRQLGVCLKRHLTVIIVTP